MTFLQLNPGSKISALATKILSAPTPEDAKNLFFSLRGGGLLRSRLKKKLLEIGAEEGEKEKLRAFLVPAPKSPVFLPPNREKALQDRLAKWQQVSDNLMKMDSVILKEYRERRAEFKSKIKKNNYPF